MPNYISDYDCVPIFHYKSICSKEILMKYLLLIYGHPHLQTNLKDGSDKEKNLKMVKKKEFGHYDIVYCYLPKRRLTYV